MSDVHIATDARLGRRVAVKLLKSSLASDPIFRTRFRQEAQAAARMAHPTIVRVFDAGEESVEEPGGGETISPFIVMEYVEGRLLKDIIADGPMAPTEATRVIEGVLTALEYSHRAGVVHRDIKPGNIMVTNAGQVKVMDFGIARAVSDSAATVAISARKSAAVWKRSKRSFASACRTTASSAGEIAETTVLGATGGSLTC